MGDQVDRDGVDPGIPAPRSLEETGKLLLVRAGKVFPDLPDLVENEVEIVEEPFGRRGDRFAASRACDDRRVDRAELPVALFETAPEEPPGRRARYRSMQSCQAFLAIEPPGKIASGLTILPPFLCLFRACSPPPLLLSVLSLGVRARPTM
jgi:hypothetical protein